MSDIDDGEAEKARVIFLSATTNDERWRMLTYLIGAAPDEFDYARNYLERTRA